jgi:Vitamin K-dependent gamma-carboxylase
VSAAHKKVSPVLRWGRRKAVELFGADLRSLAAFRMALAVLVLADLLGRGADLYAHYTDRGVLPRGALQEATNRWQISLNLMNGDLLFQVLLFDAAALAALTLLIGYRTRLMTVVVWVLVLSIQARNPLVLNTGDTLLRLLLFWGMFLPLGAYWSVDRALKAAPPRVSTRFLSAATVGLLLQIAFVYWFSALQKTGPEWRTDGTAVYYALSVDAWGTATGAYLYQFPALLTVLTYATILLEAFGPFLLFFPLFTGPVRTAAILAFMGLHFGIWMTMPIGIFSWIAALCMVCFLPGWFWDKAAAKLRAAFPEQPKAVLRLRRALTRLLRDYWVPLRARLSALAGTGRTSNADAADTAGNRPESRGARDPAPTVTPASTPQQDDDTRPTATATAADPEGQHDAAARTEPSFEPPMLRSSLVTNLLAFGFVLYVFCWNLATVSEFTVPESARPVGSLLGLRQDWGVFAPYPTKTGGWYVIPGNLQDGQQVDLMAAAVHNDFELREGVSWEEPESVSGTLKNKYWRKYLTAIRDPDKKELRKYFGRYICREWNARHTGAEELVELQIVYMRVKTLPDYQRSAPEKAVLWQQSCS